MMFKIKGMVYLSPGRVIVHIMPFYEKEKKKSQHEHLQV